MILEPPDDPIASTGLPALSVIMTGVLKDIASLFGPRLLASSEGPVPSRDVRREKSIKRLLKMMPVLLPLCSTPNLLITKKDVRYNICIYIYGNVFMNYELWVCNNI